MTAEKRTIPKGALCGSLLDASPLELGFYMNHPQVDLVEWRLDAFIGNSRSNSIAEGMRWLSTASRLPVLVTNRPVRMGGSFEGDEASRVQHLFRAGSAGADWIDLEADTPREMVEAARGQGFRILLSHHDFSMTPERKTLRRMIEMMAAQGPHAIKLVTFAHAHDDNLRLLELIPFGRRELGIEVIAFCMGDTGRWSRVACLLLGSSWTYVQLPEQASAAPGQYTALQMRAFLRAAGWRRFFHD